MDYKGKMKHVQIIIPTNDTVEEETLDSVMAQDYPDFSIYVSKVKSVSRFNDRRNISFNSTRNLNEAREKVLKTDADYFLLVDSDVVLPQDAITKFMLQVGPKKSTVPVVKPDGRLYPHGEHIEEKHIIGGWYPMIESNFWVAGKWIGDCILYRFKEPQQSIIKVDMVGLGCTLLSREALQDLEFIDGTDRFAKDISGHEFYLGPCLAFSINAQDKGYDLWMNGDVICKHLTRKELKHAA